MKGLFGLIVCCGLMFQAEAKEMPYEDLQREVSLLREAESFDAFKGKFSADEVLQLLEYCTVPRICDFMTACFDGKVDFPHVFLSKCAYNAANAVRADLMCLDNSKVVFQGIASDPLALDKIKITEGMRDKFNGLSKDLIKILAEKLNLDEETAKSMYNTGIPIGFKPASRTVNGAIVPVSGKHLRPDSRLAATMRF